MIRQEIPDEAWEWLEPLLPDRTPRRGGRWRDHRTVLEGIVWRFRTGSPWRDLPDHYGPWQTVYDRFNRWSGDGTWDRLLARAQAEADARGEIDWLVAVDSTSARVHQHGATLTRTAGNAATAAVAAEPACGPVEGAATGREDVVVDAGSGQGASSRIFG